MKVIFILSLVFASALCELSFDRDSSERVEQRQKLRPIPLQRQQHSVVSGDWPELLPRNGDVSEASKGLTASTLSALLQQRTNEPNQRNEAADSTLGLWATYPDAAAFEAKIKLRLETSKVLSTKPDIRNKLTEVSEGEFNKCKGLPEERERACLGHSTGRLMQLIAAVENMHRSSQ